MKKLQIYLAIILSLAIIAGCSGSSQTPAPTDVPVEPTVPVVEEPAPTEEPVAEELPTLRQSHLASASADVLQG